MKTLQAGKPAEKPAVKTKPAGEVRMGRDVSSKKASGGGAASDAKATEKKQKAELQEDRASSLV